MTEQAKRQRKEPPVIQDYQIDTETPLHRLFLERMTRGRDLKIIITADDSETGVGKTTLAGWLALSWNPIYADTTWNAEEYASIDPNEFFKLQMNKPPGSVLILDDAEELDARRSMANENVEFSHRWMIMRVRQLVQILTLPSPKALDSRLKELADVWINVVRRGKGEVHDIRVNSYSGKILTPKIHEIEFPNVAEHPELVNLQEIKDTRIQEKLNEKEQEMEEIDAEEMQRQQKIEMAQRMRDNPDVDMTLAEIADVVGMSAGWVSENTEKKMEVA